MNAKNAKRIFNARDEIALSFRSGFINDHATTANTFIVAAKTKNELAVPDVSAK